MKTKMKFFAYILFSLFLGLAISSCEGPEGPQGIQGEAGLDGVNGVDGTDGTDGTDGEDGEDGEDASASVYVFNDPAPVWTISGTMDLNLEALTLDIIENHIVLAYLEYEFIVDGTPEQVVYAVPGLHTGDNYYVKSWMNVGVYHMKALIWNGTDEIYEGFSGATNPIAARIMVIAPTPPTETTMGAFDTSLTAMERVAQKLENEGVDITNYNEVAAYYGLNK